jgi:hypothetical protein
LKPLLNRSRLVQRLRARLVRDGYPRLQMSLIVLLTGGAGFLASSMLLQAGLETMWLRYLLAFAAAYPAFLVLLWLWLRTRAEDYGDLPDLSSLTSSSPELPAQPAIDLDLVRLPLGEGGQFGGGGASAGFDAGATDGATTLEIDDAGGLADAGDALGAVGDADEFAIVLLVLILLLAVVITSAWLVYTAPGLFAELTVDGALTVGLYRRLKKTDTRHWLETALRRTWLPFAVTAAVVATCGWFLQDLAPTARTIAEVIAYL